MNKKKITWAMVTLAGAALASEAAAETFDRTALEELTGEPITLSATGAPQRVTEAPVNMTIITQEQIATSGAIDIPGVLERLANVDVIRTSRGMVDVSIRGYNSTMSPRLLVLLNGRQVYLDHYGMTNWNIPVQMSEIRQIEVVSGPNTALFGFNAVAGVVNIITYDTLQDDVDAASVTAGDPEYVGGSAVLTQRVTDQLGLRLSLGGFEEDSWSGDDEIADTLGVTGNYDPTARNAAFNAAYDITDRVRADFEATWTEDARLGRFLTAVLNERYETNSLRVGLSADTSIGLLSAQVYRNELEQSSSNPATTPQSQESQTTVASASLVTRLAAAHTVRGGVEYRHNEMQQDFGGGLAYDVYALSGMWNWQFNDALALTTAVRVDQLQLERSGPSVSPDFPLSAAAYDQDMTETSYNVGLVYRLSSVDALRLSAARGIGSPSLNEYGVQALGTYGPINVFYGGSPQIAPTIVDNAELSWDRDLPSLRGRLRVAAFWQENEAFRLLGSSVTILDPTNILLLASNIGDSNMVGLEAGIAGQAGRLHWDAQYSWRNIDDALTVPPSITGLDFENSSPEHIATASLTWVGDHWEFGGDARYTSETLQYGFMVVQGVPPPVLPTDSYLQANLHVAWLPRPNMRVELSGRDLLDDETQTVGYAPVERSVYLSVSSRFGSGAH